MKKLNLDEKCFEGDKEFLSENIPEVERLILKNPFSGRMIHLLRHQELYDKPVLNLAGKLEPPNCMGTAFWIAGVSKLDYPYQANDCELNPHMKVEEEDWEDHFRVHSERKIPGAFAFSYSVEIDSWHAGIYLGEIKSRDILFAQHGTHKMFGIETWGPVRFEYYIPATLKKNSDG